MATWEEIRDEIAEMLADGQPLEEVINKLEKRKNEMAKANLLKAMDELKKPKPMTNEEWFCSLTTKEKAKFLRQIYRDGRDDYVGEWYEQTEKDFDEWLKQPHITIKE